MAKKNSGEKAPSYSSQPITDDGKMVEAAAKTEARQDTSAEQGKSTKVEIAPDDMQMVLEQLQAMRSELQSARDEIKTIRNDIQELGERVDYLESQRNKRAARKKSVGILATIGASFRSIFSKKPEQIKADEQGEDADVQPTAKLDPIDVPAPVTDTQASSGVIPDQNDLEVLHKDEIHNDTKPDSDTSDNEETDNPGRSPEKHKWRRRIGMALAGIALAAGIGTGVANCDAITNYLSGSNPQEAAATATATVQNEVDDLAGVLAVDPSKLSGKQLEEQMNKLQQEKADVAEAIEKNGNADADTLANARGILDSEDTLNYQEDLQSAIDAFKARSEAAEKLGVDIDTYAELERAADRTNLTIEQVKQFSEGHGVPADKLNTPEAFDYVRDGRDNKTAVGETALTNESEDVEARRAEVKYLAATNPMVAAQIMAAINEDTTPDAGIDGIETGTQLINQYLTDFVGDYDVYQDAVQDVITPWIDGADAGIFEAKHIRQYSVGDLTQTDDQLTVTNSYQDNNGGNPYVLVFENGDVTIWIKLGCGVQLTVPTPIQVVVEKHTYTPNRTTTTTNPPVTPVDPPTITTEPKDPTKDVLANPGNQYAKDDVPVVSDQPSQTEQGSANNDTTYVDQNGDQQAVGNTGSKEVPSPSDDKGNIGGLQEEDPGLNNW